MSLYLDGTVDPIAALGARQVPNLPWHFHVITLGNGYYMDVNTVRNWIWTNQSGRFYIGTRNKMIDERLTTEYIAAFEDSSEAIMFSFILPTLKNSDNSIF